MLLPITSINPKNSKMLYINTEDQITDKTKILRLIPLDPAITMLASGDSNLNKAIIITNKRDIDPALAAFHLRTTIPMVNTIIGILAINTSIVVVLEIKSNTTSIKICI